MIANATNPVMDPMAVKKVLKVNIFIFHKGIKKPAVETAGDNL